MDFKTQMKSGPVRLMHGGKITLAKADAAKADAPRGFEMLAYTGEAVKCFGERLVFSLEGMDIPNLPMPALMQHDPTLIAGVIAKAEKSKDGLNVSGTMSRVTASAQSICALADESFPWQASVGLDIDDLTYIASGETLKCNGKTFEGPIFCCEKSTLRECSFVPLGADGGTSSTVLSAHNGGVAMSDPVKINDDWKSRLQGLTISEFKAAAPSLAEMFRNEILREDKARLDSISGEIAKCGLSADAQARLAVECMALSLADASKKIEAYARVEVALSAAKKAGLTDAEVTLLRGDVAGLTPSLAVSQIELSANKIAPGGKRLITTADPVTDAPAGNQKLADAVKLAREEFKTTIKNSFVKEASYVEQCLHGAKLSATPAELKALAPDLFK